jgi:hypothetical protein
MVDARGLFSNNALHGDPARVEPCSASLPRITFSGNVHVCLPQEGAGCARERRR